MAMTYQLEFEGFWLEPGWSKLPSKSGIYCVYAATIDKKTDEIEGLRLLYIGEAEDINDRVPEDPEERRDKWAEKLNGREILCVSYALTKGKDARKRAEAAMIFQHKPPCNKQYKYRFPFLRTTIRTSGANEELDGLFTVERTVSTTRR